MDAGATDSYFRVSDKAALEKLRPVTPMESVQACLLNGSTTQSHASAEIAYSSLPMEALKGHAFRNEDLSEYSLLSVNRLCSTGLKVISTDEHVTVLNHQQRSSQLDCSTVIPVYLWFT